MRSVKPLFFFLFLYSTALSAQPKYWIYLKDKNTSAQPAISSQTRQNRQTAGLVVEQSTDLPVRQAYLAKLKAAQIEPIYASRWLNAVSAAMSYKQVLAAEALDFVTEVMPMNSDFFITRSDGYTKKPTLAPVMSQIQSNAFKNANLTGEGVTIGVIDAGFYGADSSHSLRQVFGNKRILGVRDYVKPNQPGELLFSVAESYSDTHGTEVMAAIGGMDTDDDTQYGTALNAKFYLARTDYSLREWRGEEDNWIAAMEWMDSLGVRLINTSLGYARGFTDPKENYTPSQMDGKTSAIARAAQIASEQKGHSDRGVGRK